jgi:hypothetical protein
LQQMNEPGGAPADVQHRLQQAPGSLISHGCRLGVQTGVAVAVGVLVGVSVGVLVGVFVAVSVGVLVGVSVGVFVAVLVGVSVGVLVGVFVGVRVGVAVGAGVQRRLVPGPDGRHTRPAQHCWFPSHGLPADLHLGAALAGSESERLLSPIAAKVALVRPASSARPA